MISAGASSPYARLAIMTNAKYAVGRKQVPGQAQAVDDDMRATQREARESSRRRQLAATPPPSHAQRSMTSVLDRVKESVAKTAAPTEGIQVYTFTAPENVIIGTKSLHPMYAQDLAQHRARLLLDKWLPLKIDSIKVGDAIVLDMYSGKGKGKGRKWNYVVAVKNATEAIHATHTLRGGGARVAMAALGTRYARQPQGHGRRQRVPPLTPAADGLYRLTL